MRKYKLILANSFKKDYKLIKRRKYDIDLIDEVVELLLSGKKIPEKYCDHQLKGKLKKFRELHIQPDWILVYIKNKTELILTLSRTGTHADLLRM